MSDFQYVDAKMKLKVIGNDKWFTLTRDYLVIKLRPDQTIIINKVWNQSYIWFIVSHVFNLQPYPSVPSNEIRRCFAKFKGAIMVCSLCLISTNIDQLLLGLPSFP